MTVHTLIDLMRLLKNLFSSGSLSQVRVRNFVDCVEDSQGTRVIDESPGRGHTEITIRLAPESSLSDDLAKMLNNSHVLVDGLYTEREAAYLKVVIK